MAILTKIVKAKKWYLESLHILIVTTFIKQWRPHVSMLSYINVFF
jgi:hypothetical protein